MPGINIYTMECISKSCQDLDLFFNTVFKDNSVNYIAHFFQSTIKYDKVEESFEIMEIDNIMAQDVELLLNREIVVNENEVISLPELCNNLNISVEINYENGKGKLKTLYSVDSNGKVITNELKMIDNNENAIKFKVVGKICK